MTSKLISLGQILDKSWEFYIKNFKTLMKITVWFFLVPALGLIGSLLTPTDNLQFLIQQNLLTTGNRIGMIITILSGTVVTSIVAIWIFLSLVKAISELLENKKVDLKKINIASWRTFFPYFFMSFFKGLIFLTAIVPYYISIKFLAFSLGYDSAGFTSFAILLTITAAITGLIFLAISWIWLAFSGYEIVLNGKGAIQSMKASRLLVKGRFWSVFWRLILIESIFFLSLWIIKEITKILFPIIMVSLKANPEALSYLSYITEKLVLTSFTVISLPILITTHYLIFQSLKKK